MGEHTQQTTERRRLARKRPGKQTSDTIGRRLLEIVIQSRIGAGSLTLDELTDTRRLEDARLSDGLLIRRAAGLADR